MTTAANGLQNAVVYAYTYADAAARTGASGFVGGDVGKLALQLDSGALYMLTAATPTWQAIAGSGMADPTTTKGDLIVHTASITTRKAVGADGTQLLADSTQTDGLRWGRGAGGALYLASHCS